MAAAIRGVLIDLSGTLHVGSEAIPGAPAALARLRQRLPVRFVTNSSQQSRASLLAVLHQMGFESVQEAEVFSSLAAARRLVDDRQLRPYLLLHPAALPDFAGLPSEGPLNSVVVGLAKDAFSYENLNKAFRLLKDNPGAQLVALHRGRYYKEPDGLSLGPGPFVTALEEASGKTAEVVGKPERAFFRLALSDLDLPAENCVVVGDDVVSDVGGAQRIGMRGILVRTGKYCAGDETSRGVQPDATVDDFPAAVDWILNRL